MSFELFNAPENYQQHYSSLSLKKNEWMDGIAVRSPNWLGDAIMALPAMYALKKILPEGCGFFVVTPKNLVPLYSAIPWVDYILDIGDGHSAWTKMQIKMLKRLRPGVGMLFVNSIRSAYYFKKSKIKNVFGASKGIRDIFLKKAFKVKWHKKDDYEDCHQSYKYLHMAYAMGAPEWDRIYPNFKIPKPENVKNEYLKNIHKLINLLVVQPGAAYGPAKRWDENNFTKVCKDWLENKGNVVIVGSQNEQETAQKVIASCNTANRQIIDLTGKTSMLDLMYVLKHSKVCLCNDSGVMHLASSLNLKGVALFGSTDPFATGPIAGKWIVLLKKQNCSPCFSRECQNESKDYKCLKAITPEKVFCALKQLIK